MFFFLGIFNFIEFMFAMRTFNNFVIHAKFMEF